MEQIARLIEALTPILWLALLLFVILRFEPAVKDIVRSAKSREFTLEIGGQKLTMKELNRQQTAVIADLQAQVQALREQILPKQSHEQQAPEATPKAPPARRSVLWADDNPMNNGFIVQMLRDKGIEVDLAYSTKEAIERLGSTRYGAIVSDMGRDEDGRYHPDAGLELLRKVRERDAQIPFMIYCSAEKASEYRRVALQSGASIVTSSPTSISGALLEHFGESGA